MHRGNCLSLSPLFLLCRVKRELYLNPSFSLNAAFLTIYKIYMRSDWRLWQACEAVMKRFRERQQAGTWETQNDANLRRMRRHFGVQMVKINAEPNPPYKPACDSEAKWGALVNTREWLQLFIFTVHRSVSKQCNRAYCSTKSIGVVAAILFLFKVEFHP